MPKKFHMNQCVRGALRNRSFDGFQHNDGRPMTREEAFDALCDCLKKGIECIPLGDCDNFSPTKGCLGHPLIPSGETGPFRIDTIAV